jgi:type I restriction enzyme S subunit
LAFYLKSQHFRAWTSEAQGANIKNIKKSALEDFKIQIPGLVEQRRIVDLLSRAEGIIRLRREAEKKAAELIPALFLDMFGDPATNPKGWPYVKLGDYLSIESSVRTPDSIADATLPCIGADSIESGTGKIVSWPTVELVKPISGKYYFECNDVLYSKIRPALRKVIVAPEAGYCSADMYPLRPRNGMAVPEYVAALLLSKTFTDYAVGVSARAQMPKVNRETLFAYQHPMPPIRLQEEFASRVQQVSSILLRQEEALATSEQAFNAQLRQSFA